MSTAAKQTTGAGRRQRRDRPTSGAAAGQGARRKKGTTPALPARPSLTVSGALRGCAAGRRAAMLVACVRVGSHWSAGWTRGGSRGRVSAHASCQSNSWQSGVTVEQLTAMPSSVRRFRLGEPLRGSWGDGARPAARRRTLGCHDFCEFASGSRPARLRRKRREASEQVHGRSFGRPAASQQDPADVCKPGSSVANSTVVCACACPRTDAALRRFARRRSPGRRRFSPTGLPAGAFKDGT